MVCHHSVEQREKFKGKEQLASHAREYVAKWKVMGVGGRGEPKKGGEEPKNVHWFQQWGWEGGTQEGRAKKGPKRQKTKFGPASWSGYWPCGLCTDGDR